jgi:heme-degrading monooxygenase HmoA
MEHLKKETFPSLSRIAGFIDAEILRCGADDGVEFLVVTRWHSIEAIRQFAGQDADAAVVPEKVKEMMIGCDLTVRHYEVVHQFTAA